MATNPKLIQNYGLHWKREDVYWGKRGRGVAPGRLLGVPANAKKGKSVNFNNQSGVYVLYANYQIVYVGQTGTSTGRDRGLFARLKEHRSGHLADRWNQFSWFGLKIVNTTDGSLRDFDSRGISLSTMLDHLEAVLIYTAEPSRNKQGGKFGAAKEYLQYRDVDSIEMSIEDAVLDTNTVVHQLLDKTNQKG